MHHLQAIAQLGLALNLLILTVGCGSPVSSTGEMGRVSYTLHSDYQADEEGFDEAVVVTGHSHQISTTLTKKGEKKANNEAGLIQHEVASPDVEVETHGTDDPKDDIPTFDIMASEPGIYTIHSTLDGQDFDHLDMTFGRPDSMKVITWFLRPESEEWEKKMGKGPHTVEMGTQVTFLPVPTRRGKRLVGDVAVDLSVDDEDMIAGGDNVLAVYEQRVISTSQPVTLFLIETGEVQVQLTDTPNSVSVGVDFIVK